MASMPALTAAQEWRRGWRVVAGAAIGSGLGIPLFYYTFSLFVVPMTQTFGVTRGEMANYQALIVAGALSAPLIGRWLDAYGFARVFAVSTLLVAGGHVLMATSVTSLLAFAAIALLYGAAGIGAGPLAYSRAISAWFVTSRGLALGVVALGLALTAIVVPPLLAALIEAQGWRAGYLALAAVSVGIGLPAALWLVKDAPASLDRAPPEEGRGARDEREGIAEVPLISGADERSHLRERDFWLLAASLFCMALPGAGLVSQLSPLVQEEGIGPAMAALGVSGYAVGQLTGRIVTGWFLDRANPIRVAFFFTFVPAIGFILLALLQLPAWAAIVAVALVGVQQGAEIDVFAWFTARRFGLARYGAVYGWIIAASWVGNATGVLAFGWLHDWAGSYAVAELIGAGLMMMGAVLVSRVRLPPAG